MLVFFFTAMSSQSQEFKVVHLKHSLLTLSCHSKHKSPLSVFTLSFLLLFPLFSGLSYLIDTLRTQSLSLRKPPGLLLHFVLLLIPIFDHFLFLLLSSEENAIYPQVVWASLNGRCEEIEGESLSFFLIGLKTRAYFLHSPHPLSYRMNHICIIYPQCPLYNI